MTNYANEVTSGNNENGLLSLEQVTSIVNKINGKAVETVERGALEIGGIALEDIFHGSLDEATSRNPFKDVSMILVCADKRLLVTRRRLGEYVRAAWLSKDLIAKDVECSNLGYSHFAALLQVNDAEKRQELAAKANEERWTARRLIDEVNQLKVPGTKKKAQKSDKSSDERAERLLGIMSNPQALMEDEETKIIMASPVDMRYEVTEQMVAYIAGRIDHLIASMRDSTALLKLAKKNMRIITLERLQADDDDVIDVQATAV